MKNEKLDYQISQSIMNAQLKLDIVNIQIVGYNSDRNSDDLTSMADKYKIWLSAGAEAETGIPLRKIDDIYLISMYLPTERKKIKKSFQNKLKFTFQKCKSNRYLCDQGNIYSNKCFKDYNP